MEIDYRKLSLFKLALTSSFATHWLACFWKITTVIEDAFSSGERRWDNAYLDKSLPDATPGQVYTAALYWAIVTMSTIGYGDVVPVTDIERIYVIFAAACGASLYAYLVGSFCGARASTAPFASASFERARDRARKGRRHLPSAAADEKA